MIPIFLKEVRSLLSSLIAYVVISVFLTAAGLIFWVFPETSVLNYGYAEMDTFFNLTPYIFMFLVPGITMRSFAEESRGGTLEMLLTKPVSLWSIILGKYFSTFFLVVFSILPTLIYYFSLSWLGPVDTAGISGSYVGLILLGGVFSGIGVFSSSLTQNQIVSFIIAVFLCFLWHTGFGSIAQLSGLGNFANPVEELGLIYHYDALSRGLIDSRNVVYFVSVTALFLVLTHLTLSSKKW